MDEERDTFRAAGRTAIQHDAHYPGMFISLVVSTHSLVRAQKLLWKERTLFGRRQLCTAAVSVARTPCTPCTDMGKSIYA